MAQEVAQRLGRLPDVGRPARTHRLRDHGLLGGFSRRACGVGVERKHVGSGLGDCRRADLRPLAHFAGWSGVLFVHQGYYRGAVLHFTLAIPSSYPSKAPSVTFESPVFHPLVDPVSGNMRLDWRFPTWRPREDCIWNVLHAMKAAFKRKALDQLREAMCANVEAYHTYREQTALFAHLASQTANLSTSSSTLYASPPSRLEDTQPSPIRFRRLEEEEEKVLKAEVQKLGDAKVVKVKPAADLSA
ncbi:Ubiquitin-conjugating enzyme/RWD-like protein [Rhodotorula toruloides]|uniref:Ubiquitin-conjugating enzyme/RWD-like protein n=1 Tax=Rhodotorula toruloides TaxID=5286 RepID=A0A2T0AGJ0_RHOTO|nr:Ubiquitin-conjugating enzyme/RWD-like protein [Rhodotorula toruloides]